MILRSPAISDPLDPLFPGPPPFCKGIWGPYYGAALPGKWLLEGGQSAAGSLLDSVIRSSAGSVHLLARLPRAELTPRIKEEECSEGTMNACEGGGAGRGVVGTGAVGMDGDVSGVGGGGLDGSRFGAEEALRLLGSAGPLPGWVHRTVVRAVCKRQGWPANGVTSSHEGSAEEALAHASAIVQCISKTGDGGRQLH